MDHLILPQHIHHTILNSIGAAPCESGGVLAMKENRISDFYYDIHAGVNNCFYIPSVSDITTQVNGWLEEGMTFCGFIHSHRWPYNHLSAMDIVAAEKTMATNQLNFLYMAIVCEKELYFYKVIRQPGKSQSVLEPCSVQVE